MICEGHTVRLFSVRGYWIRGCARCKHRYAELVPAADHVRRIYGDDYFCGGGAGYSNYCGEAAVLRSRGNWYGRLLSSYLAGGLMLDVGCAAGFVLQGFRDCGWSGVGLEPNSSMAAYARSLGLTVESGVLEDLRTDLRFDLVSMIQVVAHFTDLRRAFAVTAALTKPGGYLLVETWNRESWTARLLGSAWHEYSPPSVLHWFSPGGLARFAAAFGFQEVARGRPPKRISLDHAIALLKYRCGPSSIGRRAVQAISSSVDLARVPRNLTIPYPGEDLFYAIYRKELTDSRHTAGGRTL